MESLEYQDVVSKDDIKRFPVSFTTTEVNLTGSWRFLHPETVEKISPCSVGCPANTNIPAYINAFLRNDIDRAVEILRRDNPFPATCGRVCPHFCENRCNRAEYDGPVKIGELEKFIGDYALNIPFGDFKIRSSKKIAVIGGGPAGLSCAYFLAKNGYRVKIFERRRKAGGLLVYGIPPYRLPRSVVEKEIKNILDIKNIDIEYESDITPDGLNSLKKEFDAVFISTGLAAGRITEVIQPDGVNILSGYGFLSDFMENKVVEDKIRGKKVAIIGGGNAAFDVARVVLRLGGDPIIVYRRTLKESPAFESEKEEAVEEGVKIIEKRIVDGVRKGDCLSLDLVEVENIENNKIIKGGFHEELKVDKLIITIGQKREFEFEDGKNVFYGGDYAHGAATVIEAIASAKKAAFDIIEFLKGVPVSQPFISEEFIRFNKDFDRFEVVGFDRINLFYFRKQPPVEIAKKEASKRIHTFDEIDIKPSIESILKEANRCFSCGVCNYCKTCWFYCPDVCINVKEAVEFDYDYCKGCGVCYQECPRGVIEMVEDK